MKNKFSYEEVQGIIEYFSALVFPAYAARIVWQVGHPVIAVLLVLSSFFLCFFISNAHQTERDLSAAEHDLYIIEQKFYIEHKLFCAAYDLLSEEQKSQYFEQTKKYDSYIPYQFQKFDKYEYEEQMKE